MIPAHHAVYRYTQWPSSYTEARGGANSTEIALFSIDSNVKWDMIHILEHESSRPEHESRTRQTSMTTVTVGELDVARCHLVASWDPKPYKLQPLNLNPAKRELRFPAIESMPMHRTGPGRDTQHSNDLLLLTWYSKSIAESAHVVQPVSKS